MEVVATNVPVSVYVRRAYSVLSRFPLWKLERARVRLRKVPDTDNPGGYDHLGVSVIYETWFGVKREITLYFEMTAPDDVNQKEVAAYAERLIASVNSLSVP